jgi:hypothetical protein
MADIIQLAAYRQAQEINAAAKALMQASNERAALLGLAEHWEYADMVTSDGQWSLSKPAHLLGRGDSAAVHHV